MARPRRFPRGAGDGCVLTIVRHHRVYGGGEDPLYRLGVGEAVLDAQLAWLARRARVVTLAEGSERLARGAPGHWVAITFDDGYADNVERALPLLRRHGLQATFFLTAGLIEERRTLWWDELAWLLERATRPAFAWEGERVACATRSEKRRALVRLLPAFRATPAERRSRLEELRDRVGAPAGAPGCELMSWEGARALRDAGMELGAHTLTHPVLSLLPEGEQLREIEGSRRLVEAGARVQVGSFAYPGGDFSEATVAAVRAAGCRAAVTTRAGTNGPGSDPLRLARRPWAEGACLGPGGRFSAALAGAELDGAFDHLRRVRRASA
jgi:peptidoglycan/xylan/chitin deacetylase (PgdA/CDA1 family)